MGSFLEASVGSNPSFVWRSLMVTQDLIKSRIRWRIGDGASVRLFSDSWLPNTLNPFIESNTPENLSLATVDTLINPVLDTWNTEVIGNLFSERDAQLILSIHLPKSPRIDKCIWSCDQKGHY